MRSYKYRGFRFIITDNDELYVLNKEGNLSEIKSFNDMYIINGIHDLTKRLSLVELMFKIMPLEDAVWVTLRNFGDSPKVEQFLPSMVKVQFELPFNTFSFIGDLPLTIHSINFDERILILTRSVSFKYFYGLC